ncbi:hypothetical protein [Streptomyces sp. L-9-10]|uniref:hypothetical protein n=1 Tax=unclassified Streptomyces TaxID=2593676 RepID=UPI0013EAA122|nr:hypothetical protein [Streptomyces sp. L-9-10]
MRLFLRVFGSDGNVRGGRRAITAEAITAEVIAAEAITAEVIPSGRSKMIGVDRR